MARLASRLAVLPLVAFAVPALAAPPDPIALVNKADVLKDGLAGLGIRHREGADVSAEVLGLLDRWSLKHLTGEDFLLASYLWSRT